MQNTEAIPDETIASLVQQHLIVDSRSNHSIPSAGSSDGANDPLPVLDEIPVPYHLPGAAITHDIYTHANSLISAQSLHRSKSTTDVRLKAGRMVHDTQDQDDVAFENLDKPGGFRRFHVQQQRQTEESAPINEASAFSQLFRPTSRASTDSHTYTDYSGLYTANSLAHTSTLGSLRTPPHHQTRHFLEYLAITSVLPHFAGEDLSDSDNDETPDEEEGYPSEAAPLLRRRRRGKAPAEPLDGTDRSHKANTTKTVFLLFKAFIGSGILFLPKAFSNGGLVFSFVTIWTMGLVSLYCFLLLLDCKKTIAGSYGDVGGALYGPWMRNIVLFSIAISQLGFVCGGTIFIVENITTAVQALYHDTVHVSTTTLFAGIAVLLMPLVLIRNIAKLSPTALLSDVLIITGLLILLTYDLACIFFQAPEGSHPPTTGPNIHWWFNSQNFSVFIGTAVYSFEGIGLIIPIRDSMEKPEKFPWVLTLVMGMVATSLCLVGSLGYIAYGSDVKTVALLNLPPGALPITIQFGYSVAVHLSNALTLFPTIRIVEQAFFGDQTGKHNMRVKWEKNALRCCIVIVAALVAWGGANDLDKFISLIGSVCCCPLSLIFPPLFHLKLGKLTPFQRIVDVLLILFGTGIMLFTLYNTSRQWASSG